MHTIASQYASISRLGFGTLRMSGGGCQPVSRERSRSATAISVACEIRTPTGADRFEVPRNANTKFTWVKRVPGKQR